MSEGATKRTKIEWKRELVNPVMHFMNLKLVRKLESHPSNGGGDQKKGAQPSILFIDGGAQHHGTFHKYFKIIIMGHIADKFLLKLGNK